jgi:hypothetical protein
MMKKDNKYEQAYMLINPFLPSGSYLVIEKPGTTYLVRRVVGKERIQKGTSEVVEALEVPSRGVVHGPYE